MSRLLALAVALALAPGAGAAIYRHVDARGHVTYTDVWRPGAMRLDLDQAPLVPLAAGEAPQVAPSPFPPRPASFRTRENGRWVVYRMCPRASPERAADGKRQRLLRALGEEEEALAGARMEMMESAPQLGRSLIVIGEDGDARAVPAAPPQARERVAELEETVREHLAKVEALRRELARC